MTIDFEKQSCKYKSTLMNKIRIIPRIDLKNNDVIKGYHLEVGKIEVNRTLTLLL